MTAYRQPIRPDDKGLDIYAVRRVLRKRGHDLPALGYVAGSTFVQAIKDVQRVHKLTADGVYGPATHAILGNGNDGLPCFDKYGVWLYTHATLRFPYVNPFGDSSNLVPGRTDEGVDYHGEGPILALGDAVVIGNGGGGWPGGEYLLYKLSNGPQAGRYVYVAEGITPTVGAGMKVSAGQTIAHFRYDAYPDHHPGIETGWSTSTLNLTWAAATTGYREGQQTEAGKAFARLLRQLGAPTEYDPGPGPIFPYPI